MEKHDTLLIFSPLQENREHLRFTFSDSFNLLEAVNMHQTLHLLRQNLHCIAAVILDASEMATDFRLTREEQDAALLQQVPLILLTAEDRPDLMNRAFLEGAADVIPLGYNADAMLHRVLNIVDLHLHKQHLEAMVQEQANALRHTGDRIVDVLSSIIEYRSVESGQHILRIRHFTKILLEEVVRSCPEYALTDHQISIICGASALHDIGKIAIPDAILTKPGPLTEEEREIMKTHAVTGCHILDTLTEVADQEYLAFAHRICHYHHERWDGSGYPDGLAGDEIPICAQVVGLADAFDALTTKRVYKDAVPFAEAVNMILRGECGAFSQKLLECFKHVSYQMEALAQAYADGMSPRSESFEAPGPEPLPEEKADSMERTRGKYYALVHYINGFLMELDLTKGIFHLIYNPYPHLSQLREQNSLEDIARLVLERIVHPHDRDRMEQFFRQDISRFLEEGLRRQSFRFRLRSQEEDPGELFDVALLRINPLETKRRSLAILARRCGEVLPAQEWEDSPWMEGTYRCRNDRDFTLISLGTHTHQMAGYTLPELRERFGGRLMELVHPDDRDRVRQELRTQLTEGIQAKLEYRILAKDGSRMWVLNYTRLTRDREGNELLHSFCVDITHTHRATEELEQKLRRYEIILAQTENVLFEWDIAKEKVTFSDTWEKIFGFPAPAMNPEKHPGEGALFHPDDMPLLIDKINALAAGSAYETAEIRMTTARGRYIWCRLRASAIRDEEGKLRKLSGIIINIDAEKRAAQQLQDRALRDPLTKLLNKDAGRKQAEDYFSRYPAGVDGALLIIDLDNFKQVNDRYGHLFGDSVLTQAAREIRRLFRNQDIVARIGGDEFMVVMRGVSDRQMLEHRCSRITEAFRNVFQNHRYQLPLSCSIGVALSPESGKSYFELFRNADLALYQAKARGKNCFVIHSSQDSFFQSGLQTATAVNNVIDSDMEPGLADDNIVRYAFSKLYSAEDMGAAIHEILSYVGRKMNVSRVYVFENSDDNRFCSNTYEWCNDGIPPEMDMLQNISYETDIPGYADNFNEEGIFYCPDISVLPDRAFAIVAEQGIKSMLQCAIRENGVFRGYIGFDECVEQRFWTKDQIQLLLYFSEALSMFLLRARRQQKVQQQADELRTILDNQNAWIYIIDPETCELKYLNAKTRLLAPEVEVGMPCYRALMGREERCPGCPALGIRQCRNNCTTMKNSQFHLDVIAEATLIHWRGEESCLLTCREIPRREQNLTEEMQL